MYSRSPGHPVGTHTATIKSLTNVCNLRCGLDPLPPPPSPQPHAVTEEVKKLVATTLEGKGIKILTQGEIKSEVIDEKKLIDQHYYAIASKATILTPDQLNVPADKFEGQFGLSWTDALATGRVMNAMDGCAALGKTADEMDTLWGICKKAKKLVTVMVKLCQGRSAYSGAT